MRMITVVTPGPARRTDGHTLALDAAQPGRRLGVLRWQSDPRVASGAWSRSTAEHYDRPGGENAGAAPSAAADAVDEFLEMVEVAHADVGEGVGISCDGE